MTNQEMIDKLKKYTERLNKDVGRACKCLKTGKLRGLRIAAENGRIWTTTISSLLRTIQVSVEDGPGGKEPETW